MGGTQFSSYESKQAGSCLLFLSAFCILISSDTSSNDPPGLWCYWQIRAATWKGLRAWPVVMASSSCWHSVPQKLKDVERLGCPVALQWGASSPAPPWPDPMSWSPPCPVRTAARGWAGPVTLGFLLIMLLCAVCLQSKPVLREGWHHLPVSTLVAASPSAEELLFSLILHHRHGAMW